MFFMFVEIRVYVKYPFNLYYFVFFFLSFQARYRLKIGHNTPGFYLKKWICEYKLLYDLLNMSEYCTKKKQKCTYCEL